jgi:hypothetical protein
MRGIKVLVVMLAAAAMASILTVPISTAQGGQKIQILFKECQQGQQGQKIPVITPDPAMVRPGDQVEWFVSAAVEPTYPHRVGLDRAGGALGGVAGVHDPPEIHTQTRRDVKALESRKALTERRPYGSQEA